jgi:hypothetical protein
LEIRRLRINDFFNVDRRASVTQPKNAAPKDPEVKRHAAG